MRPRLGTPATRISGLSRRLAGASMRMVGE
jgi:hypothetical protein